MTYLYSAPWGRSRPHLSLREGLEKPPFPSRFIFPDRSSPSRIRFAASRPGRLRADPKDALLTRGKGGRGARGRVASPLAHDKGYYHSYTEGAARAGIEEMELDGGAFMGDSVVDMNDIARAGPRPPDRVAVKPSFRKFLQ